MKDIQFKSTPEFECEVNKFNKDIERIEKKLKNRFLSQKEKDVLENELDIVKTNKERYVIVTKSQYEIDKLNEMMNNVENGSDEYLEIQRELDTCEMIIDEITL